MAGQNKFWLWAAVVCLCLGLICSIDMCRSQVGQAKKDYDELKRVLDADHEIQAGIIARKTEENEALTQSIRQMAAEVSQLRSDNNVLTARLDALQGEEPVQPELESEPLVINLRSQVKTLTEMFTLANRELAIKDNIIKAWEGKYNAQVDIADAWKKKYENERSLREAAEGLFKISEHSRKANKTLTKVAIGIAGAGVVYGLLK